jgi:hypothetical protein
MTVGIAQIFMLFKSLRWTFLILISYDSKSWTDERKLTSVEMYFMRKAVGYTLLGHKTTELIKCRKD